VKSTGMFRKQKDKEPPAKVPMIVHISTHRGMAAVNSPGDHWQLKKPTSTLYKKTLT
jgi:hypothetical protein